MHRFHCRVVARDGGPGSGDAKLPRVNASCPAAASTAPSSRALVGAITDLGIEFGRLARCPPHILRDLRRRGVVRYVLEIPPDSDLARAMMHLTAIVCFLLGATVGPLLFVRYAYRAMFAPASVLVVLVAANHLVPRLDPPRSPP